MNEKQLQIFQLTNRVNRASEIGCLENSDLQTSDPLKNDCQLHEWIFIYDNYQNENDNNNGKIISLSRV